MGLLKSLLLAAPLAALQPVATALDWQVEADVRATLADTGNSFLDGGLGKFRQNDGASLQLGRGRIALEQRVGDTLRFVVDASTWGDNGPHPIDLTETFAEYRSYPHGGWRMRVKAGAFYPPSSLENRAAGWRSPYTISSSALNTWIAEEIRSIGAEVALDRLASKNGSEFDWGLFGGVYGWNDPAGVLVATHGFALHDRQTTLHDHIGPDAAVPVSNRQLFYEIDNRPGYYAGGKLRHGDRFELRAMHYDNRADVSKEKPSIADVAWLTKFDTAAMRLETTGERTWLAQWLDGRTDAAVTGFKLGWRFDTWNLLVNQRWGAQSLSARYDRFRMWQVVNDFGPASQVDRGTAWTLAYSYEREGAPWRFMAEAMRVDSWVSNRRDLLGLPPSAIESKLELSLNYRFSGQYH